MIAHIRQRAPIMRRLPIVLLLCCLPLWVFARTSPEPGDTPPNSLGKESRSGDALLVDGHRGKVLVVSFWASWCGPCLQELPILEGLQQQVSPARLRVVAINYQEDIQLYLQHLKKMQGMKMSLVHDRDGRLADAFGVESLPHLFMIDHLGRVAHVHQGYSPKALPDIVDEINALLLAQGKAQRVASKLSAAPP
jgi:thiol-disulfide isomerase/thioredoxin